MSKWVSFPVIECPKCGKKFQVDDYYDLTAGSFILCQHCEAEIVVLEVDIVTEARIGLQLTEEAEI